MTNVLHVLGNREVRGSNPGKGRH